VLFGGIYSLIKRQGNRLCRKWLNQKLVCSETGQLNYGVDQYRRIEIFSLCLKSILAT
jgi:hypothetical protein